MNCTECGKPFRKDEEILITTKKHRFHIGCWEKYALAGKNVHRKVDS